MPFATRITEESPMTDAVFHPTALASGAALHVLRFAALVRRSLSRARTVHDTRPALDELPDNLLKDLGLARSDIPFVAGEPASGDRGDAFDRFSRSVTERDTATRLSHAALRLLLVALVAFPALAVPSRAVHAEDAPIERGRYLVNQ
jgi:uncharacterized protein YjiS (DUF1127 family)